MNEEKLKKWHKRRDLTNRYGRETRERHEREAARIKAGVLCVRRGSRRKGKLAALEVVKYQNKQLMPGARRHSTDAGHFNRTSGFGSRPCRITSLSERAPTMF